MTGKIESFVYRESVRSYLEESDVRHAVDLLLASKIAYMPQDFTHMQIADFYKACLAARQTQIEFAHDMADLWAHIWSGLPDFWQPVLLDPTDKALTLEPVVRWDEGYFQRSYDLKGTKIRADLWLYLGSNQASTSDVELGCALWDESGSLLKRGNMPEGWTWHVDNEDESILYTNDKIKYQSGLDLASFKEAAEAAITLIDKLTHPIGAA